MKLFLISHENEDGESQDWFVVANTRTEAVREWQDEVDSDEQPTCVWLVPATPDPATTIQGPRALSWWTEVANIGKGS
jgi:hypothetical protein